MAIGQGGYHLAIAVAALAIAAGVPAAILIIGLRAVRPRRPR